MNGKNILLFLVLAAGVLPAARALDPLEERTERQRIGAERAEAEAAYARQEKLCRERFVVSSCLDDAKRERRRALERLRQQEAVLDEGQRKQHAAQRLEDIGAKLSERDTRRRETVVREPPSDKLRGEKVGRSGTREASAASAPAAAASAAAAQRAADYEQRQAQAREHREAVERRNAERAKQGKAPAKPLPVPGASAPG